jgi:Protein of unknown function (DUF790)
VIAMVHEELARLYDAHDLPWIAELIDVVEQSVGVPWRVLVERVELADLDVHVSHRTAMLRALRRMLAGGGTRAPTASSPGAARMAHAATPGTATAPGAPGAARTPGTATPPDAARAATPGAATAPDAPDTPRAARAATPGTATAPDAADTPRAARAATPGTATAHAVRASMLGATELERGPSTDRLSPAAELLGAAPSDSDVLRWFDFGHDRPVAFPRCRPSAVELAAFANLERLQRWARRAHQVQLRVWDHAHDLARAAASHGLLAQVRTDGDATVLDIIGPLALLTSTTAYGRALAALVPALAGHVRFELDLHCKLRGTLVHVKVAPPLLLPPVAAAVAPVRGPSTAELLACELARRGYPVERSPPPVASGEHLLLPDLALELDGTRWLIEVLGYSTNDYLFTRLERYRSAGIPAVALCVASTSPPRGDPSRGDPPRDDPLRGDPSRGDSLRNDPLRDDSKQIDVDALLGMLSNAS